MKQNYEIQTVRKQFAVGLISGAAAVALLFGAIQAQGQSILFDFEGATDQGWGTGFGDDASATFPIVSIGGSQRMAVTWGGSFQAAGRASQGADAFLLAFNAATAAPGAYVISYDYYIDTSLQVADNYGTFLQLGTFINSGNAPFSYAQNTSDINLSGGDLDSGLVFSGTISETLTAKYGALPADFLAMTSGRMGLIINDSAGSTPTVYFDNISITPVPEPSTIALAGLGIAGLLAVRRFRKS